MTSETPHDNGRFTDLVERLASVLADVDQSGLHPGSVMAEAEARLLNEREREPKFSTGGGARLVLHELDTQGLRWWLRGTSAGAALASLSDDEITRLAQASTGPRDALGDQMDEFADQLGEAALRASRSPS